MGYSYHEFLKPSAKSLWKHGLFWLFYISYEIFITRYVAHVKAHPLDYLLHYIAYITFFYTHIFILYRNIKPGKIIYISLVGAVIGEIILLYLCNTGIYYLLQSVDISTIAISPLLLKSFMATVYRAVLLMILSTAYFLIMFSLMRQKQALIAEREAERLRADLAVAELAFLKSQIKPHFLFNRLFELYEDMKGINRPLADRIMSMTELMQYAIVADSSNVKIPLQKELDYIKSYLFLQQIKYPEKVNFELKCEDGVGDLKIIPLLLITLVENVFDHADLTEGDKAHIQIALVADTIMVKTYNKSYHSSYQFKSGIGLTNLKDRLAHYYPNRHQFKAEDLDGYYFTELSIYLK